MSIQMGPVLSFRGSDADRWKLSAVVVSDGAPGPLTAESAASQPVPLWTVNGRTAYRFEFSLQIGDQPRTAVYDVAGSTYQVAVPGRRGSPRMAYASCNGFSSLKLMRNVRENNRLWATMSKKNSIQPYHLILQGGDQVYADTIWETVGGVIEWAKLDYKAQNEAEVTSELQDSLNQFYFDLYADRWAQPDVAKMLACLPSIAMWDDHDLIDGWGSFEQERQQSPTFQAIWKAASKAFATFQQHIGDGEARPGHLVPPGHGFTLAYKLGQFAIVALDMRSERTLKQVMSEEAWTAVYRYIETLEGVKHLLLLSSIPVVYPGFDTLERLLGILPGRQDLEDDLRDHWNTREHRGERLRLIHRLLGVAKLKGIRPTIISGDVHVAALGVIESVRDAKGGSDAVINQLISSGIVHPGPGASVLFALKYLFDSADELDRGIVGRMTEFPGNNARFLGSRNFLSLEPDEGISFDAAGNPRSARIWANWIVEGEEDSPYTKVIHPLDWEPLIGS